MRIGVIGGSGPAGGVLAARRASVGHESINAMAVEAFTAVMLHLDVRSRTRVAPAVTGIKPSPEPVDC